MMGEVVVGMLIGAITGSLLTAAYLGMCLKQEDENSIHWIDRAIARAFNAVEGSAFEELPPRS